MGACRVGLCIREEAGCWEGGGEVAHSVCEFGGAASILLAVVGVGGAAPGVVGSVVGCPAMVDGTVEGFDGNFVGVADPAGGDNGSSVVGLLACLAACSVDILSERAAGGLDGGVEGPSFGMNSPVKISDTMSISSYISGHGLEFRLGLGLGG